MNNILFSCGDTSADIYLSLVLKNIKETRGNITSFVLGGEKSKLYSDYFIENLVNYDAHGFFSPFFQFFKFIFLLKKIENILNINKISLVVLLDYYGFNIRVAKLAKKLKIKVIYYITPQVWASRKYRIDEIKKYVDFVINIYPFESEIYNKAGIKNFYFGHPITDVIENLNYKNIVNGKFIGIFPGSRKQVVKWNFSVMLKIATTYLKKYGTQYRFIIFGFKKYEKIYNNILLKSIPKNLLTCFEIYFEDNHYLKKKLLLAISVSGTVVLENVFFDIPTIIIYKLPILMYILLKRIVYVKFISLPNIILNKQVLPEFIQGNINTLKIVDLIHAFLKDKTLIDSILAEYKNVKLLLFKTQNVSKQITKKIIEYLNEKN